MKKVLILVIAAALVVWVISWFRAPKAVATAATKAWPGGMGPLDTVAKRYPPLAGNEASTKLSGLAKALPENEAITEYVSREIGRGELTIGEPPALPDVAAIRELILREPLVFNRREGIGGDNVTQTMRGMVMTIARALVANALAKARKDDPTAWEDLHAVWKLARSLDPHPQVMAQTAALSMARFINGVAWKMPLPAPAWFAELQQRDNLQPLLEAYQFQTAEYWADGSQMFPTKWHADSVEHDRLIAEEIFKTKTCEVKPRMNKLGVDLTSVWKRAFRYRAEREATANALRIREGKPIETASVCSDGTWSYDGTTLRFSRELTTAAQDRPMPLVLQVKPGEPRDAS